MRATWPLPRLVALALVGGSLGALTPAITAAQPLIVLDAGHGGSDPGAVGCALEESAVVLDVAQRLQVLLEGAGVRTAMTRDDDTFVGLSARAAFANSMGADGFFSVHSNANAGTPATGTETFVLTGAGARSRALGQGIQDAMIAAWMLRDRGLKEANFAVLRDTSMPAALGELAFTNNCGIDAPLLSDPAARQRMAEHQRDAILEWLGITPTTPVDGTLRGVVFEDQGVGTEDLTVRLPGATVRVVETGAMATAAATDGAWSFTVPAGTYTIEASSSGHVTTSRSCVVTNGMETWCSVGLLPDGVVDPDAGPGDADAGVDGDAGATPDVDGGPGTSREPVGCGCAVPGRSNDRGALLLSIALGACIAARRRRLARRSVRRALWVSLTLMALAASGCAHESAASETASITETSEDRVVIAAPASSFATLGAPREWLAEELTAPLISPDGAHVALATEDHRALFVAELAEGGAYREICRGARCGWEPRWQDGGASIAYRIDGQSGTAVPGEAVALADLSRVPVRVGERGVHAWTDGDDRAWLRHGGRTREIGPEGERMMMPAITGDGLHVAMWGMRDGVFVHRIADGVTVRIGEGGHPSVDPSGRFLVFERTLDDGHAITRSDLYVVDLADRTYPVAPLLASVDRIERMPSLSRIEGGRGLLAYLAEGALVVREVVFAR